MRKNIALATVALMAAMTSTSALAAEDLALSGKVFFDYATHTETGKTDQTGGNLARTYLSAKKKMDNTWSAAFTIDSALNNAHDGKRNEVFLKKAQLTGKFSDALNIKLGLIATPWIGYEDKQGKHRYISKSFADTHKIASSADAGIGVFGKLMDGMVSYDVVSINGGGYGKTNITDKTDIELRLGAKPIEGLTLDLGYRNGYMGKFVATTAETKVILTQFLITYGTTMGDLSYRAGLNFITNEKTDELAVTNATITEKGTEIWAWVRSGQYGGYMRSESLDNGVTGDATEKRTVLSLDYHASKTVVVSLVSDSTTDAGGTAGSDKSKTGLFTQFTF